MSDSELQSFRLMRDAVVAEHGSIVAQLDDLKAQRKAKTATYQQLFARKMTLSAMLDIYKKHGLL